MQKDQILYWSDIKISISTDSEILRQVFFIIPCSNIFRFIIVNIFASYIIFFFLFTYILAFVDILFWKLLRAYAYGSRRILFRDVSIN